jgi:hypothetical protein
LTATLVEVGTLRSPLNLETAMARNKKFKVGDRVLCTALGIEGHVLSSDGGLVEVLHSHNFSTTGLLASYFCRELTWLQKRTKGFKNYRRFIESVESPEEVSNELRLAGALEVITVDESLLLDMLHQRYITKDSPEDSAAVEEQREPEAGDFVPPTLSSTEMRGSPELEDWCSEYEKIHGERPLEAWVDGEWTSPVWGDSPCDYRLTESVREKLRKAEAAYLTRMIAAAPEMHVLLGDMLPWLQEHADEETNKLWGRLTAVLRKIENGQ